LYLLVGSVEPSFHAAPLLADKNRNRSIATIQGRPLGIRDEAFDVHIPTPVEQGDEDTRSVAETNVKLSYSGVLSYPLHRFRLDRIISEIKLLLYHLPTQMSSIIWPTNLEECQKRLHTELDSWHYQIPEAADAMVLVDESDRRQWYIKLELQYFAAIVLLFQPSQVFHKPSDEALLLCFQCAARQIQGHNTLHEQNALYPSWRAVQSVFASGATMIYCFWTSKVVRSSPEAADMPRMLRMCSNLLSIGGEWWPSAKQGKISFEKVVDVTLRKLSDIQSRSSSKHSKRPVYGWDNQGDRGELHLSAAEKAIDQGSQNIDTDTRFNLSKPSGRVVPQQYEEDYGQFPGSTFDFGMYSGQANTDLSRSAGLGGPDDEMQPRGQNTDFAQSTSGMHEYGQSFTGGTPNSIDPEIQDFLTDFWTGNPSWTESDIHAAMSFDLPHPL
jgi:hypothetical protein